MKLKTRIIAFILMLLTVFYAIPVSAFAEVAFSEDDSAEQIDSSSAEVQAWGDNSYIIIGSTLDGSLASEEDVINGVVKVHENTRITTPVIAHIVVNTAHFLEKSGNYIAKKLNDFGKWLGSWR